jgi:hypothetical protein
MHMSITCTHFVGYVSPLALAPQLKSVPNHGVRPNVPQIRVLGTSAQSHYQIKHKKTHAWNAHLRIHSMQSL